ncbi:hemolysin III family protein [Uliginosibacterium sp. sgz301328]|uniref:PAQR family membrane homeostasis protein TrhA n=1 Tax=Uliginosibacterium sp. sgz301328 TaxID=3243764 RepID=UPI00359D71F8
MTVVEVAKGRVKRLQTLGEEVANSISHGVGCVAAIVGAPFLVFAALDGGVQEIIGASVFAATMILMYLSSTLYHAMPRGRVKEFFHRVDHAAIYLLIAGTYTPFTLGVLSGTWGWTLFGLVWALAAIGLLLKAFNRLNRKWLSVSIYLAMGWLIVIAAAPMSAKVPLNGLLWLAGGGLAYTVGTVFYALSSRLRFFHFIWHLFVLAGATCHFFAVLWYAA